MVKRRRQPVPIINSLKSYGFYTPDMEIPKRLICAIYGHTGKGKSHVSLTAPSPIAVFNMDLGLTGVVHKFLKQGKDISVINLSVPPTQEEAILEWEKFIKAWTAVLGQKDIRTVVVDTETQLWELKRMAEFGKLSQIKAHHYGPANADYSRLLREADTAIDKTFIFLRHLSPVYIDDKRTAKYESKGFGSLEKFVQVVAEIGRDSLGDGGGWWLEVNKCRLKPDMDGRVLANEMATFPWLATLCV